MHLIKYGTNRKWQRASVRKRERKWNAFSFAVLHSVKLTIYWICFLLNYNVHHAFVIHILIKSWGVSLLRNLRATNQVQQLNALTANRDKDALGKEYKINNTFERTQGTEEHTESAMSRACKGTIEKLRNTFIEKGVDFFSFLFSFLSFLFRFSYSLATIQNVLLNVVVLFFSLFCLHSYINSCLTIFLFFIQSYFLLVFVLFVWKSNYIISFSLFFLLFFNWNNNLCVSLYCIIIFTLLFITALIFFCLTSVFVIKQSETFHFGIFNKKLKICRK